MINLNYYQELELIEQPDVSLGVIWSKLYMQLHLAFADLKNKNGIQTIGVSFPEYNDPNFPLGKRLRLFAATEKELTDLAISHWLSRLADYIKVKDIHAVPSKRVKEYAVFSRKEIKRNPEAIARRRARKDPGITYEEALRRAKLQEQKVCLLPFINLASLTSVQRFKLFIDRKEEKGPGENLEFSSYGLSHNTPVPIF